VQGGVAAALEALHAEHPLSGRLEDDVERLLDPLGDVVRFAAGQGPPALSDEAAAWQAGDRAAARSRLLQWWDDGAAGREDYLSRALLRPYVELLARHGVAPDRVHRSGCCPFCGGAPWIAARRAEPDADGARRLLGCALCGGEWTLGRILCPGCEEGDPAKLPAFQAQGHPAVRIEACETCRRYVKSIDLTVDARAIPEVDDLVSLSLDLWAAREGFTRIEPGMAGDLRQSQS
jgi:hypothetical protein